VIRGGSDVRHLSLSFIRVAIEAGLPKSSPLPSLLQRVQATLGSPSLAGRLRRRGVVSGTALALYHRIAQEALGNAQALEGQAGSRPSSSRRTPSFCLNRLRRRASFRCSSPRRFEAWAASSQRERVSLPERYVQAREPPLDKRARPFSRRSFPPCMNVSALPLACCLPFAP